MMIFFLLVGRRCLEEFLFSGILEIGLLNWRYMIFKPSIIVFLSFLFPLKIDQNCSTEVLHFAIVIKSIQSGQNVGV